MLDTGFGNNWLSYRACKNGSRVLAWANVDGLVDKVREFYNGFLELSENTLEFR